MNQVSQKITGEFTISLSIFREIQSKVKNISNFKEVIEKFLDEPVTRLLEVILGGGIELETSDLHIEPQETEVKIRIRIDGVLYDVMVFDSKIYQKILSRIKLLSGLKLNITARPQDGRFSILLETEGALSPNQKKRPIEVRTSTIPTEYGESIVLRILNPKSLLEVDNLGLRKDLLDTVKEEIKKPNGMIIVTGPTGSGKTTTLYAFLKQIQKPEIKIITIEDPIEYHLKGISQTQVNPAKGYDFATGLKSIMRQDPDVILVGEIRDQETATTALQAALTGHLVFSTLHTNDAVGTIARLVNLKSKPSDIGPAINLVIAQRLVRKICQKCSKLQPVSSLILSKIKKVLKKIPKEIYSTVLEKGKVKIPKITGCKDCNFTGYRGRIGIFETFLIDSEMEKFILTKPSVAALREKAIKKGMVTMYQDGILKALEGITTIEEVERVAGE